MAEVQASAPCRIVFVCTGNTCRSPLAEALCKKRLADQLGCGVAELAERGFVVASAGVSAYPGDEAASFAVEVAAEHGASLNEHRSQPLAPELAETADYLLCMTQAHLGWVRQLYPDLKCPPRLLSSDGTDVDDPIGADVATYRACAEQILRYLDDFLATLPAVQTNA